MLTDTHCHLFYDDLKENLPDILDRAKQLGVDRFICVATNLTDALECLKLAERHPNIWASAGVHPHDAKDAPHNLVNRIRELMNHEKMVAVGEIGLDYFRNISDQETQKTVFRKQMSVAQDLNMPVISHNRNADEDVLTILSEFPNLRGVAPVSYTHLRAHET